MCTRYKLQSPFGWIYSWNIFLLFVRSICFHRQNPPKRLCLWWNKWNVKTKVKPYEKIIMLFWWLLLPQRLRSFQWKKKSEGSSDIDSALRIVKRIEETEPIHRSFCERSFFFLDMNALKHTHTFTSKMDVFCNISWYTDSIVVFFPQRTM